MEQPRRRNLILWAALAAGALWIAGVALSLAGGVRDPQVGARQVASLTASDQAGAVSVLDQPDLQANASPQTTVTDGIGVTRFSDGLTTIFYLTWNENSAEGRTVSTTGGGSSTTTRRALSRSAGVVRLATGDGGTLDGSASYWIYQKPGNYRLRLSDGSEARLTAPPPPSGTGPFYLTVADPKGIFAMRGKINRFRGFTPLDSAIQPLVKAGAYTVYQARTPGYYSVETIDGEDTLTYYVFVSPLPSRHNDRADRDWYLTQWNTETTSNCGPTVSAMSVGWSLGQTVSVVDIRHMIGWTGDGAISLSEMQTVLNHYGVPNRLVSLGSPDDIFAALDRGHLVAVSYNMNQMSVVGDPSRDLLGQYYSEHGGHYLAIKGYSLDRKFVIVYDPIPSDWALNAGRYGDGKSMYGRNRYYPVSEFWAAMRSTEALEIGRPDPSALPPAEATTAATLGPNTGS